MTRRPVSPDRAIRHRRYNARRTATADAEQRVRKALKLWCPPGGKYDQREWRKPCALPHDVIPTFADNLANSSLLATLPGMPDFLEVLCFHFVALAEAKCTFPMVFLKKDTPL